MADLAFIRQGTPFLKKSQEMEDMRFPFSSPGEGDSEFFLCNHCFLRGCTPSPEASIVVM